MKFDFGSLDRDIEADWPVRVSVPQDGGKAQEEVFLVRFRVTSDADLISLGMGVEAAKKSLRKCIVGLAQSEGRELTDELLTKMLDRAYIRTALVTAYSEFSLGIEAKN
jgi:hypothetical protein